ncbi:hypothetical protein BEL04_08345 [Mucilaginibacter sp. PPCGB 2223]|nr:hypothetical protein BEL04_08345 [Mucilaginibacter sp. PPCGB 2223]
MALACLLLFFGPAMAATSPDSLRKDSLQSVIDLSSHKDTVRINEVIVFKLKLREPASLGAYHTLYLNGIKVDSVHPWKVSAAEQLVYFKLSGPVRHLAEQFLTAVPTEKMVLPVNLGIGGDQQELLRAPQVFQLEVNQHISAIGIWLMAAALIVLVGIGLKFHILKDDNNLYYSLGRTQMLFWTLLFSLAYLYLCGETGTLPDIPSSMLVILGISAATTAASKFLDNSHKDITPIDPTARSEGFWLDILSDGSSINIQRFQNVVFNLLFGIIFVQKVLSARLMPDFDNNVLLMLGISAGTYAGMKVTEVTKAQNQPAPPVNSDQPASQAGSAVIQPPAQADPAVTAPAPPVTTEEVKPEQHATPDSDYVQ